MPTFLALSYPAIDPVAIQIGPLAIRWYALAYVAGLLIGWRMVIGHLRRDPQPPMRQTDADDFLVWAIVGVILGGRLGYVLFYNPDYYLRQPLEALFIWRGGMSFHGGLVGMLVAMWLFCRRRSLPFLRTADLIAAVAPVGFFFGRIANFINAELWGRPSDVPWAMVFPGAGDLPRHPSQLYEAALEGLLMLVIVQWMYRQERFRQRPGLVAGVFLAGYAVSRMFCELFRQPDTHIGYFPGGTTMGQWLSVPVLLVGLLLVFRARTARRPRHR